MSTESERPGMLLNQTAIVVRTLSACAFASGFRACALGLVLIVQWSAPSYGALVTNYDFTTGGTAGTMVDANTWEFTVSGLSDNGVTFEAVVTVEGTGTDVNRTAEGLDSVPGVQSGETFSVSVAVQNVSGGTVNAAFTRAILNTQGLMAQTASFTFGGDPNPVDLDLNGDAVSHIVFAQPYADPFTLTGNNAGVQGFRLQGVRLQFDAAAGVPEPASLAMGGLAVIAFAGAGYRRRRRRRQQGGQARLELGVSG